MVAGGAAAGHGRRQVSSPTNFPLLCVLPSPFLSPSHSCYLWVCASTDQACMLGRDASVARMEQEMRSGRLSLSRVKDSAFVARSMYHICLVFGLSRAQHLRLGLAPLAPCWVSVYSIAHPPLSPPVSVHSIAHSLLSPPTPPHRPRSLSLLCVCVWMDGAEISACNCIHA